MKITQSFTTVGGLGAIGFSVGPIITAWGYISALAQRGDPQTAWLLFIAGALATTISIPAMLIGREYVAVEPKSTLINQPAAKPMTGYSRFPD